MTQRTEGGGRGQGGGGAIEVVLGRHAVGHFDVAAQDLAVAGEEDASADADQREDVEDRADGKAGAGFTDAWRCPIPVACGAGAVA